MKKIFFFAAMAAVALASCSNDEVVQTTQTSPANEISFRPFINNVTRAADITDGTASTDLQGLGFWVTAIHKKDATTTTYFDNVQFTWTSTSSTYNSVTKYYWPADGTLDFFAYAPTDEGNDQITRDGTDYKKFTVTPSTTIANQVDLVYANTDAKTKTGTYTPEGGSETTYGARGVPLNFRHTGSKIVVKVKNSEDNNLVFEITGMKIVNVDGTAVFEYDKAGTDVTTDTKNDKQLVIGDWSDNTTYTASYSTPNTFVLNTINTQKTTAQFLNSAGVTGDAASVTEDESINMILIPQTTPNTTSSYSNSAEGSSYTGSYIALKMVIKNKGTNIVVADASQDVSSKNKWAMWPVKFTWVPGKKYTYTIDLANGGYWELNDDDNEDLDPILENALIKFVDVTVDDWSAETESVVTGPTL